MHFRTRFLFCKKMRIRHAKRNRRKQVSIGGRRIATRLYRPAVREATDRTEVAALAVLGYGAKDIGDIENRKNNPPIRVAGQVPCWMPALGWTSTSGKRSSSAPSFMRLAAGAPRALSRGSCVQYTFGYTNLENRRQPARMIFGGTHEFVPGAAHLSFLAQCKSDGRKLLELEGDPEPLCDDAGSRTRAELHSQLKKMIAASFERSW